MAETQEVTPMSDELPRVIYWLDNQVTITFLSPEPISLGPERIIQSLHLDRLNAFLNSYNFNLTSFGENDVPHPVSSEEDDGEEPGEPLVQEGIEVLGKGIKAIGEGIEALGEKIEELGQAIIDRAEQKGDHESHDGDDDENKGLNSTVGKYLFASGSNTFVVSFFHVERTNGDEGDSTVEIVNLLNNPSTEATLKEQDVPDFTAMPNWTNGGTQVPDFVTHGCPVDPPFPVSESCEAGRWTITLQQLIPGSLQDAQGAGVRVFILDTLPAEEQIKAASEGDPAHGVVGAGNNNLLLKDLVTDIVDAPPFNAPPPGINYHYQTLSDPLDDPNQNPPLTGKDIYERLVGFPVVDHGLFIAGIVRDLAPKATIECVRVLNDFGVGDTTMLTDTLQMILQRKSDPNDLQNQPIVINMSLVATPADADIVQLGFNPSDIDKARAGLAVPLKALSDLGVVFAASSGNDSAPIDPMNMSGCRYGPRYPAAFVYSDPNTVPNNYVPTMIPVGAVDKDGNAASYSNYPGTSGIATYAGSLLNPQESLGTPHDVTHPVVPIDALRGVYSSTLYPRLSKDDTAPSKSPPPPDYPEYPTPNPNAWAYWSGTSFATPIISVLAARILELMSSGVLPSNTNVPQAVIAAAGEQTTLWTRLQPDANGMCNSEDCTSEEDCISGPLIMAIQECQPTLQ